MADGSVGLAEVDVSFSDLRKHHHSGAAHRPKFPDQADVGYSCIYFTLEH
jgi:hypothetical protein